MGAWFFADRMIEEVMVEIGMTAGRPVYVGRPAAASPATGLLRRHLQEQETLIEEDLNVKSTTKSSATKIKKAPAKKAPAKKAAVKRAEEHTSELQSLMRISYSFSCLQH